VKEYTCIGNVFLDDYIKIQCIIDIERLNAGEESFMGDQLHRNRTRNRKPFCIIPGDNSIDYNSVIHSILKKT
jgi:hypothetical protein